MRIFFKKLYYWLTSPEEIEIDWQNDYLLIRAIPKKYTGKLIFKNTDCYLHDEFWYLKNGLFHREDGPALHNKYGNYTGALYHIVADEISNARAVRNSLYYGHFRYYIDGQSYYLNGISFDSKEAWFEALTEEQKTKALFNLDEWR